MKTTHFRSFSATFNRSPLASCQALLGLLVLLVGLSFTTAQAATSPPDTNKPLVSISTPAPNQKLFISEFTPSSINGTATDNTLVARVQVKLFRNRDGVNQIWNGTAFTTTSTTVAADFKNPDIYWSLKTNFPPTNQLDAGLYTVEAYATDTSGNSSSTRSAFTLVDFPSPVKNALFAWGYNGEGTLGDGTKTDHLLPWNIMASGILKGKTFNQVVAGYSHSVVLCSDGTVAAWGRNSEGQLGDGTNAERLLPVAINGKGALRGKTVIQITADAYYTLARCSDGTIAAWGSNRNGELGTLDGKSTSLPVAINNSGALKGKSVTQIVTSDTHALALCGDGRLIGWGSSASGATHGPSPEDITDAYISTGRTITQLVATYNENLALCNDGSLTVWGTAGVSPYPYQLQGQGALSGKIVTQIAGAGSHFLALCSDGTVVAWGNNQAGQGGDGTTKDQVLPVAITGNGALRGKRVIQLFAGYSDSFALCSDGTVAAWGRNGVGQLGDGTVGTRLLPVNITIKGALKGAQISQLVGDFVHSLAIGTVTPDTEKPTVTIDTPISNQQIEISDFNGGTIRGSASDNVSVYSVRVKLYRTRNGVNEIWNGNSFTTTSATVAAELSGSGTALAWSLARAAPFSSQLDEGVYRVIVNAIDEAGNLSSSVGRSFILKDSSNEASGDAPAPSTSQGSGGNS